MTNTWDYLIVTASNETQGASYKAQLAARRQQGLLPQFREVLVVADLDGKRIGSGGSTILCLMDVLDRELAASHDKSPAAIERVLRGLRVMIVHAGGDSRRLPAYGPCGKIFIPVPSPRQSEDSSTLFDRILPTYLALPAGRPGTGQVLVVSGDALLVFDPSSVRMDLPGLVALGTPDTPEHASKHGVFVACGTEVTRYLQKPSPAEQAASGALTPQGQALLDIGVMSFDTESILILLAAFEVGIGRSGTFEWAPFMRTRILTHGLDVYREICCALGTAATLEHYLQATRSSGSRWDNDALARTFLALRAIPLYLQTVPHCKFLHFGTTRQLITSGIELVAQDTGAPPTDGLLVLNTTLVGNGRIAGGEAWIEGCRITAPLTLGGKNAIVGADLDRPLSLPPRACLDLVPGWDRAGTPVHFVRCYDIGDTFKYPVETGGMFCGRPLLQWLDATTAPPETIWPADEPAHQRTLWTARVFPAVKRPTDLYDWLWMFDVDRATPEQKRAFLTADRYSSAEIALTTNQAEFHARRRTTQ